MIKNIVHRVINVLYPFSCPYCRSKIDIEFGTCNDCWPKITAIEKPFCTQCATPIEAAFINEEKCGSCLLTPPEFDQSMAAFAYSDLTKKLTLRLKRGQATPVARYMAHHMLRVGQRMLGESDYIIPVPLHNNRLKSRGFNQSTLLAKSLDPTSKKKINTHILRRHKDTPSQGQLKRRAREENIKKAFLTYPNLEKNIINDKVFTLIDDVMTTGATLNACAKVLKDNGAKKVNALVFSRAIR